MKFTLRKRDASSKARLGVIETQHGIIETPVFLPVGTRGAVKTLTSQHLLDLNVPVVLGNAYHLMLRPGVEVIAQAGGLHSFMQWPRPLLTDSGGYQIFSLGGLQKVTQEGVDFHSHIDGSRHRWGPEESMRIQKILGADFAMAFDECSPYGCPRREVEEALERTLNWAVACRSYTLQPHQSLFGVVQGGFHADLRQQAVQALVRLNFDGYAIGGLSVREPADEMLAMVDATEPWLPQDKPRYLMGVGTPRNIIEAVMRGIDMFDCVLPTRNARNGTAFTWSGKLPIKAGRYAADFSPLDDQLDGYASQFSRAYVRHLLNVGEITGLVLMTLHNLSFYLDFMHRLRQAIANDTVAEYYQRICALYPK